MPATTDSLAPQLQENVAAATDEGPPARPSSRQWLADLGTHARPLVLAAIAAGLVAAVATIVQLGLIAWTIDQAITHSSALPDLYPAIAGIIVAIAVRTLAQIAKDTAAASASQAVRQEVRKQLAQSWQHKGPNGMDSDSPATHASEWLEQVEALDGYYARFMPQMLLSVLVPVMILLVVFPLDYIAGGFLLLSAPLIPLFMALVGMGAERLNQQHFETLGRLSGHFLDQLRGILTLQLFNQTEHATRDVREASDAYRRTNMKTLRIAFLSSAVLEFFASVAIAVIAIYIGFGLLGYINFGPSASLTLFTGLFVLMLAPEFFQPLRQLSQYYHDRAAALGASEQLISRLQPVTDTPSPTAARQTEAPEALSNQVEIEDVTVAFSGRGNVLSSINLAIPRGSVIGLAGPSGSGKSTLLNLIAGFQQPTQGRATVFGAQPGYNRFGWLGQEPYLYHGSWAENLRLVAPEASDASMLAALDEVGLRERVDAAPTGLHAPLFESGAALSGGQARRLSLARVLLSDYDLVLLDEPTAGLDEHSERMIINALQLLADGQRTLIFSSHHAAMLAFADKVYQLNEGRLDNA
ncbi:thiol reductant ABC exporter subunit CydD [Marinobacter sp. BGYM27]|uniref:thiol reductant ABC exporter subunit CydD n=1 Tax=Marinobacter sp. BGYM27 TaxID=2975597 RepID=UPI0021A3DC5E|nr:thiol reductant ABC exporter subunit CydD [Marinobacter sp. BGYM27]MDG5499194.1 thiol reductant ABC exporter subunit CydD [Marinobacter sp. BGYM27]